MNIYESILENSKTINWTGIDISNVQSITFPVPKNHFRYEKIKEYQLVVRKLNNYFFTEDSVVLCDESVRPFLVQEKLNLSKFVFLKPTEDFLKTITQSEEFLASLRKKHPKVFVIGGGIISNFGGYIAERLEADLVYIPTTIIAMSDACIGGKVRINNILEGKYFKHAHKSFYEPSEIIIDPRFLDSLEDEYIKVGLAEIIKHAIYQSQTMANYILSEAFDPFANKQSLLRVILWTADLKRVCLEMDPEESRDGSYCILRAAHDISDQLEEQSGFTLSHGKAVEKAMVEDLQTNPEKKQVLLKIYQKLRIETN